ncbi:hypothetical protein [Streptoalloteichus hindustanus]|uniref:Small secreted domain n=1 Tax=Streptoalloteichus hindustanus TaxID=2017 RepID=A0A1M5ITY7_STRHI|nr:hypothetical protein [Streptoalloteichus hindustanus]SHG31794.1 hypothetical protein SAMN05444320_1084 [Streptoalloteichus hindustanus]
MLKKTVGVVAAAAGAMAMLASPALASGSEDNDWNGSLNLVDENQIQVPIGICENNIGIIAVVAPILSPMFMESCSASVATMEESDHIHVKDTQHDFHKHDHYGHGHGHHGHGHGGHGHGGHGHGHGHGGHGGHGHGGHHKKQGDFDKKQGDFDKKHKHHKEG